jgi:hypothetical protein
VFETSKARTVSLLVTLAVAVVDASPDVEREADEKKVGETDLVAKEGYEKASLGQRVWYTVRGIL